MYGKSSELPTSMTAIRLWRQLCVRKYLDEGKSLYTVLSLFGKSLRDEIKTYYQSCLDDDDYPLTRHAGVAEPSENASRLTVIVQLDDGFSLMLGGLWDLGRGEMSGKS